MTREPDVLSVPDWTPQGDPETQDEPPRRVASMSCVFGGLSGTPAGGTAVGSVS